MHWNYRLVVTSETDEEREIELCEVYYNDCGEPQGYCRGVPSITEENGSGTDSHQELKEALADMHSAMEKTVLKADGGKLTDTRGLRGPP